MTFKTYVMKNVCFELSKIPISIYNDIYHIKISNVRSQICYTNKWPHRLKTLQIDNLNNNYLPTVLPSTLTNLTTPKLYLALVSLESENVRHSLPNMTSLTIHDNHLQEIQQPMIEPPCYDKIGYLSNSLFSSLTELRLANDIHILGNPLPPHLKLLQLEGIYCSATCNTLPESLISLFITKPINNIKFTKNIQYVQNLGHGCSFSNPSNLLYLKDYQFPCIILQTDVRNYSCFNNLQTLIIRYPGVFEAFAFPPQLITLKMFLQNDHPIDMKADFFPRSLKILDLTFGQIGRPWTVFLEDHPTLECFGFCYLQKSAFVVRCSLPPTLKLFVTNLSLEREHVINTIRSSCIIVSNNLEGYFKDFRGEFITSSQLKSHMTKLCFSFPFPFPIDDMPILCLQVYGQHCVFYVWNFGDLKHNYHFYWAKLFEIS